MKNSKQGTSMDNTNLDDNCKGPSVHRCAHDKENPYVMINQNLIRDNTISPECRWLIIYLLSNEKGWVIKINQIINHLKGHKNCGRDRVYKIIQEAIDAGYMKREDYKEGNHIRYRYIVSEEPKFSKKVSDLLAPSILDCSKLQERMLKKDQPSSLHSEERINKRERERGKNPPAGASPSSPSFKLGKVQVPGEKMKSLLREFGRPVVEQIVEELNEYAELHPEKFAAYQSHSAAIRRFIRAAKIRERGK